MTAFPAARFGLWDRGLYSAGIEWVMVGGQMVWREGKDTGALTGQVFRAGTRGTR
jgi:N-acyl-D-aspartate/D-glutamate deacylase